MKSDFRRKAFGLLIKTWRIEDGLEKRGLLAAALQATGLLGRPVRSEQDLRRLIDRIRKWEEGEAWPNEREEAALRRALRADPDADRVSQQRARKWAELISDDGDYYSNLLKKEADKLADEVFHGIVPEETHSLRESRSYLEATHLLKLVNDIREKEPPVITMTEMKALHDGLHTLRGIEQAIGARVAHHMIEIFAKQILAEKNDDRRRRLVEDGFIISRRLKSCEEEISRLCSSIGEEDPLCASIAMIRAGAFCLDTDVEYTTEHESVIWPILMACIKNLRNADATCEVAAYFIFVYSRSFSLEKRVHHVGTLLYDSYHDGSMLLSGEAFPPLATFWLGASLGKYKQFAINRVRYYLEDWAHLADGKADRAEIVRPPVYLAELSERTGWEDESIPFLVARFEGSNSKYVCSGIALLLARAGAPRPVFRKAWIRMLADRRMGRWMVLEVLGYLVHWHPRHAAHLLSAMLVRGERHEAGRTIRKPPVDKRVAFLALLGSGDFETLRRLFRRAQKANGYSPGAIAHAIASGGSWEAFAIFRLPWWRSWEHTRGVLWAFWQVYARLYYRLPVDLITAVTRASW